MFTPGIRGYCGSVSWQLFTSQIKQAQELLDKEKQTKAQLDTPEKIHQHADKMREFFLQAIGGIPDDGSELEPKITGVIKRDKYRIEKVIYHSLANYPVTANLYVPENLSAPAPAVLLCCGHSYEAKAAIGYHQQACLLAKNGFVVMVFDPPGQGERMQLIDRSTGSQIVQWGSREHSYVGLASTLIGENICRYFIRDGIRAIDYLSSRDEVDSSKIGVTGTSGGGTQSCYLMLAEPRISAAAPACYVTERLTYMKMFHPHDGEQNIFGHIPAGFNYSDFLIAFAPKPVLLLTVAYDFFPIEGVIETYNTAKKIYATLGAEDNCQMVTDVSVHSLTLKLRQQSVAFFGKVLMGKSSDEFDMENDEPLTNEELNCTKSGQVLVDFPELPSLMDKITSQFPEQSKLTGEKLRGHIKALVYHNRQGDTIYPRVIDKTVDIKQLCIEHIFFFSEPDIVVAGELIRPVRLDGKKIAATIALLADGSDSLRSHDRWTQIARMTSPNRAVFVFDVRGIGAVKQTGGSQDRESYKSMYGTLFKFAYNSWMLGDNFVCQWAYDVLRAIEMLRNRDDIIEDDIAIYGEDDVAVPGLLAAVVDDKIKTAQFKNLPTSYKQAMKQTYYDRGNINEWTAIHGMLRDFDIPDLLDIINNRAKER